MATSPESESVKPSGWLMAVVIALSAWQLVVVLPSISRLWAPLGTFGYSINSDGRITQVASESAAQRAGIKTGDSVDIGATPLAIRRYSVGPLTLAPTPGTTITLPVRAASGDRRVTMTAESNLLSAPDSVVLFLRTLGALVFVVVGAGLVLLRPSAMTFGFFLYTIGTNPGSDSVVDASLPAGLYIINWTLEMMSIAAGNVGFLMFALRFPDLHDSLWRRAANRATPILFTLLLGLAAYSTLAPFLFSIAAASASWLELVIVSCVFVAGIAALVATYSRAQGLARQRIRWVILGFALALPGFVIGSLFLLISWAPLAVPYWLGGLFWCLNIVVPITIAYAVIHHHVIDVTFVISRAVVYAALTAMLVAVFALIEFEVGQRLSSAGLAVAIQVAVSIGFAFWLNAIHGRINIFIDSTLFRRRHRAERELAQIARALPHASTEQAVDRMLVDEPFEALDLASAALFRLTESGGAAMVRSRGWPAQCAQSLDPDDGLVLRLSADQAQLDMRDVRWHRDDVPQATARPLLAIPVVVRRRLSAFVLYSGHSGGDALDPTEQHAAAALAVGAAAAYDHLEADYLRRRIAELEAALSKSNSPS